MLQATLTHNVLPADSDVLLIVKDNEPGIKKDHEGSHRKFTALLRDADVKISEVIPLRQLKVEYREFEAKSQLSNRTDRVLVDNRVLHLVPISRRIRILIHQKC